ncbi:MAG: DUF1203 domain-containing protein [Rhizobiales bacterium]|nr:DUF1203 domain-containing protein [Hyphomicrobiales bacterium]
MTIRFHALPTEDVRRLQAGEPDANGQIPERQISEGGGNPCRHCLQFIPEGEEMLVLAYRPFPDRQPYAEVGPIFLCATPCSRHAETQELPQMVRDKEHIIIRGYTSDNRIKYGTGQVIETRDIPAVAETIFSDQAIAYIHLRSSVNNCFQARIERD